MKTFSVLFLINFALCFTLSSSFAANQANQMSFSGNEIDANVKTTHEKTGTEKLAALQAKYAEKNHQLKLKQIQEDDELAKKLKNEKSAAKRENAMYEKSKKHSLERNALDQQQDQEYCRVIHIRCPKTTNEVTSMKVKDIAQPAKKKK